MSAGVAALVLCAALLHAVWNALLKVESDRLLTITLYVAFAAIIAALIAPFVAIPAPASWPYLALSVLLQNVYWLFLAAAYREGDLGQVYPIARGSAPVLVMPLAVVFAGDPLALTQVLAVLLIAAGIAALALRDPAALRRRPAPVLYALGTGCTIAAYTVADGMGARLSGSAAGYIVWLFLLCPLPLMAFTAFGRRGELAALLRGHWRSGLAGGALTLVAYGLVVWALTLGAMAQVAALRETGVIFAAIIGSVMLKEPFGRWRIAASCIVAAGIVLLRS